MVSRLYRLSKSDRADAIFPDDCTFVDATGILRLELEPGLAQRPRVADDAEGTEASSARQRIWRRKGPFGGQGNNSTREFEYPWCFHTAKLETGMHVLEVGGGLAGFQFVLG